MWNECFLGAPWDGGQGVNDEQQPPGCKEKGGDETQECLKMREAEEGQTGQSLPGCKANKG